MAKKLLIEGGGGGRGKKNTNWPSINVSLGFRFAATLDSLVNCWLLKPNNVFGQIFSNTPNGGKCGKCRAAEFFFLGAAKFLLQKMDKKEKKRNRWAVYKGNTTNNYGQYRLGNNKKATKFGMKLFNATCPFRFPKKVQNLKYVPRDFTHSWSLRNNTNFYVTVTQWLASLGGIKFSNPKEISKEKLTVFLWSCFTLLWVRKVAPQVSVSIWEPPLIVSFARRRLTNRFLISDPAFTETKRVLEHVVVIDLVNIGNIAYVVHKKRISN